MNPSSLVSGLRPLLQADEARPGAPLAPYRLVQRLVPWCTAAALLLALAGLAIGLLVAPADARQGDAWRIAYLHMPATWMSVFIYAVMAFWAALGLVPELRLASMLATALAPTGALLAFIALWTGALWGKPTEGTWWSWNVRASSELLLLAVYLGFIALRSLHEDPRRADRWSAFLALAGLPDLPVVLFAAPWWSALQPGAPLERSGSTLAAMLLMVAACWAYTLAASLHRLGSILLERVPPAAWPPAAGEERP